MPRQVLNRFRVHGRMNQIRNVCVPQLTESFCKDAGQQALAKAVELGGGVLALYALLPLASSVAELLQRMAGGG